MYLKCYLKISYNVKLAMYLTTSNCKNFYTQQTRGYLNKLKPSCNSKVFFQQLRQFKHNLWGSNLNQIRNSMCFTEKYLCIHVIND